MHNIQLNIPYLYSVQCVYNTEYTQTHIIERKGNANAQICFVDSTTNCNWQFSHIFCSTNIDVFDTLISNLLFSINETEITKGNGTFGRLWTKMFSYESNWVKWRRRHSSFQVSTMFNAQTHTHNVWWWSLHFGYGGWFLFLGKKTFQVLTHKWKQNKNVYGSGLVAKLTPQIHIVDSVQHKHKALACTKLSDPAFY